MGVLLGAGVALRVLFMLAYRPAFVGYFDSAVYLDRAKESLFFEALRPAGYSFFLRIVHWFGENLSLTIAVQHALGVGTALLLYGSVRRIGGSPWLALVPAAVVLLAGDQVFFEHAVLTESLYTFLTAVGVYGATRCFGDGRRLPWAAVAGLALGMAASVRLAGLPIVGLVALWLLLAPELGWRRRAALASAAVAAAGLVLGGHLFAAHEETDEWSYARAGAFHFYGRTASFADCTKFDPPNRTHVLCEATPRSERPPPQYYIFEGPATSNFGRPQDGKVSRMDVELVRDFARSAALAQPLDWLEVSARDFVRYVSPDSNRGGGTPTPTTEDYVRHYLVIPEQVGPNMERVAAYYSDDAEVEVRSGLYETLRDYARVTRVEGIPLGVLLVLTLVAPLACRGRVRRGALLLSGVGLALLVIPVATVEYDGRFSVPSYGFVAAAAALGAWGLGRTAGPRLRQLRAQRSRGRPGAAADA